jgi:hypothetical protein
MFMKTFDRIFAAGHFIISVLFVVGAAGLIVLAALQLWDGLQLPLGTGLQVRMNAVLEGVAILTVAVAALELGQTIIEEEVQRQAHMSAPTRVRRFLSRFLVVLLYRSPSRHWCLCFD